MLDIEIDPVDGGSEIIEEMDRRGSRYKESTIRTHVVSRMCVNAPDHHAVAYGDLERVQFGLYRQKARK